MNPFGKCDIKKLDMLVRMLEMGMWDNQLVQSFLDTLDSQPELLLPHSIGLVGYAAFLLTKVDRHPFARRALLACLTWCIENDYEEEQQTTLIDNVKHILRTEGNELEEEEIRRIAISRNYGGDESWTFLGDVSHRDDFDETRARAALGIHSGVSTKIPLSIFKGWLKRLDPQILNSAGRALMTEVFSRFGGDFSSPAKYLEDTERLLSLGVTLPPAAHREMAEIRRLIEAGVSVEMRRHRRFAGGDGRLPYSCYSSICSNSQGDDGGTLNRELMAYLHPCVPGTVFVGDSSDARINEALSHPVGVLPDYCALYVLIIPPAQDEARRVFKAVYANTLKYGGGADAPVQLHVLETSVDYEEIENVVDLRLPQTQEWFLSHFRKGDGVHLSKPNAQNISDFVAMLPTLMHPELGGCSTTHGIGSWMRTSPVNALIYPSARSDVTVSVRDGQLVGFSGWNIVDYRNAADIGSVKVITDHDAWLEFNNPEIYRDVKVEKYPRVTMDSGSWSVSGIQNRYDAMYRKLFRAQDP